MKKTLLVKIAAGAAVAAVIAPALVFAQSNTGFDETAPITSLTDVESTLYRIVNWMIVIFWIVAVLFLIWAAFSYLTAGGDEEKLGAAKTQVIYALVAGAIALLSTGIKEIIKSVVSPT